MITDIVKRYADRIREQARVNKTGLIVELYRWNNDRVYNRPHGGLRLYDQVTQGVFVEIVNDPAFRSDRADWVIA